MTSEQQAKLNEKYEEAWTNAKGTLDELEVILTKDFPIPAGVDGDGNKLGEPTKDDLDMVRDLYRRLSAVTDGYERRY